MLEENSSGIVIDLYQVEKRGGEQDIVIGSNTKDDDILDDKYNDLDDHDHFNGDAQASWLVTLMQPTRVCGALATACLQVIMVIMVICHFVFDNGVMFFLQDTFGRKKCLILCRYYLYVIPKIGLLGTSFYIL